MAAQTDRSFETYEEFMDGDGWMAAVLLTPSEAVAFPTAEEIEAREVEFFTDSAAEAARWMELTDDQRNAEDAEARDMIGRLVMEIADDILSHEDGAREILDGVARVQTVTTASTAAESTPGQATETEVPVSESDGGKAEMVEEDVPARFLRPILDRLGSVIAESELEVHETTPRQGGAPPLDPTPCRFVQTKGYKQVKNPSCGYYALFNALALCYPEPTLAADEEVIAEWLADKLFDGALFWKWYNEAKRLLHAERLRMETEVGCSWFPFDAETIDSKVMERPHVEHIINTLGLKRVYSFPDIVHTLRGASGRSIDATLGELQRIGTVSDCPPTAFCIGVPTHWVVAVVVKVGGEVEVTLVDSINHVLVGASKATLWDHVQNYVAFRWRIRQTYSRNKQLSYMQNMEQVQGGLDFIGHCACGAVDPFVYRYNKGCLTTLRYFERFAGRFDDDGTFSVDEAQLFTWNKDYDVEHETPRVAHLVSYCAHTHPRIIDNDVRDRIGRFGLVDLDADVLTRVERWASHLLVLLTTDPEFVEARDRLPIIGRFAETAETLANTIATARSMDDM